MVSWVIWYDKLPTFSDDEGESHEAPRWGVQCIAFYSADHGRVILHGHNYYWLEDGEWLGGDLLGLIDYVTRPGEKIVFVGRSVPPAVFWKIYNEADADPRLPPRSSYSALEKPP